jgi:glycosyltransferase involved in cell wall biosynthesis
VELPSISIVIPTRNSEKTLMRCVDSILDQDYPKSKMNFIIVDAFSSDKTVELAKTFGAQVLTNPRVTGEAGKAIGVRASKDEILAFIDSDNVLVSRNWLTKMVEPFINDEKIVASEPIYYGYSKSEGNIIRYCSLIGADDPLSVYLGFYGRYSYLTDRWTDISLNTYDRGSYCELILNPGLIPTMGANGFLIRANALKKTNYYPYLFDIDIIYELIDLGYTKFARVETSIFHLYASTFSQYMRKTHRRIRDYYKYHGTGARRYPWTRFDKRKLVRFISGIIFVFPLVKDSIQGYKRKPDRAWFLHWFICALTAGIYGTREVVSGFYLLRKLFLGIK